MNIELNESELAQIVEAMASTVLGIELGDAVPVECVSCCSIAASVQLLGDWQGAIVVGCDEHFAKQAASAMFAQPESDLDEADIFDAIGELANTIAGNVKPLLGERCSLSLPTVVRGDELQLEVTRATELFGVSYPSPLTTLNVRVFERAA